MGGPAVRARLDASLSVRIEHIDRTCGLSETQRKKLVLAGRGDIKRFFDHVDDRTRRLQTRQDAPEEVAKVQEELQELQKSLQGGLFGEGSIFSKTCKQALSESQKARVDGARRQSRRLRHEAKVDLVVEILDATVGFSDEQRQRLAARLLAETRLPRKTGEEEVLIVLSQTIRLPEAKLRPLFNDSQWRALQHVFRRLKEEVKDDLGDAAVDTETAPTAEVAGEQPASGRPEPARAEKP
jgi:hypothetical protein